MIRLAIGWTLVHSLWEGAAAALFLALALCLLRSSRARYLAACIALLAIVVGFALTLTHFLDAGPATRVIQPVSGSSPGGAEPSTMRPLRTELVALLPWLTPFWITGMIAFHLRSLASWLAARWLTRHGVCSPPDTWQQRFARLRERLGLSLPVTLLESCLTDVPVVIGWLQPVILIPAGLLAGMSALQVEAILIHELAHIRRRDYLVNLLQTLVEGFLFYHPAVWWISRVIRTEREHCCDDLVVANNIDAPAYAAALAALEQQRWSAHDAALAANGGNLMKRVRRLLKLDPPRVALSPILSAAILTITAALALTAWQTKPPETPYDRWLTEDVAYIINNQERAAYKALQTDEERAMFITQFWLRRDPTPGTPRNEFKEEHYRRIAYAMAHLSSRVSGWKTDRGRTYIVYGPPDEIESHPKGGQGRSYPYDQWLYRHIEGVGDDVIIEFIDPESKGEYRMTTDPH